MKAPSNRRVIDTMIAWGWEIRRQQGETVDMRWLPTRDVVTVFAATYHAGNPAPVISRIVKITTDGDHARFWSRTPRADTTPPAAPAPLTPAPAPDVAERPARGNGGPHRGYARGALIFLQARGNAVTSQEVADHLGIDAKSATNALAHLERTGRAERLLRGTYRITARPATAAPYVAPVTPPPAPAPPAPAAPLTGEQQVAAARAARDVARGNAVVLTMPPTAEAVEADMLAVLDLIVPATGIPLTALPLIDEWRTTTRRLIATLGGTS